VEQSAGSIKDWFAPSSDVLIVSSRQLRVSEILLVRVLQTVGFLVVNHNQHALELSAFIAMMSKKGRLFRQVSSVVPQILYSAEYERPDVPVSAAFIAPASSPRWTSRRSSS
jgi:hypothetical protein